MTEALSVLVSVLAHRSLATSPTAVRSALALEHDGRLIVVVREQGGDEAELAALRRLGETAPPGRSLVVDHGENLGFAAGHNRAIRASSADYVLLLNADAALEPDYLRRALPAFDDPRVGAVQGKITRSGSPGVIDTTGLAPSPRRLVVNRGQGEPDDGRYERAGEVFGPDGAVALYRRAALEDVAHDGEYLDESFFAYKCDVDLAWRLQWRGWRTAYVPEARAHHGRTLRRDVGHGLRGVLAQRRAAPELTRELSFANHRLMLVKNERWAPILRHAGPFLLHEVGAWVVFLLTERRRRAALRRLRALLPRARRRRREIHRRRLPAGDPYRFFRSSLSA